MTDSIGPLIIIQAIYMLALFLIIRETRRQKQKGVFYWFIAGVYALVLIWLTDQYLNLAPTPYPGSIFLLEVLSFIVPGILILMALIVFMVSRRKK
jgi:apolipoprotein N-acyltransferase